MSPSPLEMLKSARELGNSTGRTLHEHTTAQQPVDRAEMRRAYIEALQVALDAQTVAKSLQRASAQAFDAPRGDA